jgi:hypothetical protein
VRTSLEECLPVELRGADATFTPVAGGLSGANVFRVVVRGRAYVLKVSPPHEPLEGWRLRAEILRSAADGGVAPLVVHVDEQRRAVVSAFVSDQSVIALFAAPASRGSAIEALGSTLRRTHALPLPAGATSKDPRA